MYHFDSLLRQFWAANFIRDIRLTVRRHPPRENPLSALGDLLKGRCLDHNLTSLTLSNLHGRSGFNMMLLLLGFSQLKPLLACCNLDCLFINSGYSLEDFDNGAIKEIATAWPNLQRLKLTSYPRHWGMGCNILCLQYLAHWCPSLEIVGISVLPVKCCKIKSAAHANVAQRSLKILIDIDFNKTVVETPLAGLLRWMDNLWGPSKYI